MVMICQQIETMKPIRNNILVKPFPPEDISEGGIIVPDSVKTPSNKVKVIEVGNGVANKPMKLKQGDVGYRVKDWGTEVLIDGESHFLMEQDAILAINE